MKKKPTLMQISTVKTLATPGVSKPKKIKVIFPKKPLKNSSFNKKFNSFKAAQKEPTLPKKKIPINAPILSSSKVAKFLSVRDTASGSAAIEKEYKNDLSDFVSTTHTTMTVLAYLRMKDEHKKRLKKVTTKAAKAKINAQWADVVKAAKVIHKAAGGAALSEAKLNAMAKVLKKNKKAFNEAVVMEKSAKAKSTKKLTSATSIKAELIPQTVLDSTAAFGVINVLDNLCRNPINGSYTQHYSNSFSIVVRYTYWCPTWTNPFRTCTGSVTLAGVSFTVGIDVGYEISCCGAIAWGSGYVNACGTIIGIKKCAGCKATVVGVAGIGSTPVSGGNCSYGLGATASIDCKIAGLTVFSASFTFGWAVVGPCPPSPLPCSSQGNLLATTG